MRPHRVQQAASLDEITMGAMERDWLYAVIEERGLRGDRGPVPGTEIKTARDGDTQVTTLWHNNLPIAIGVRQRDVFNRTILTLTEIGVP